MPKILFIVGTRPELIKVAPVIREFKDNGFNDLLIVNTGQHIELLENQWGLFKIKPDYNLNLLKTNNNLASLTSIAIEKLDNLVKQLKKNAQTPSILFAQGDTTSVMAASLVAFYNKIKFAHLEAGLRTYDLLNPFPEELNRRIASIISDFNFAPTKQAKINLINEGVKPSKIYVVGNTVVDALKYIIKSNNYKNNIFNDHRINLGLKSFRKIILVTFHRRENHKQIYELIKAIDKLSRNPEYLFVLPVHKNPNVHDIFFNSVLNHKHNVILTAPLNYLELIKLMSKCYLIITDSGGIQEEAPTFGVPVLVLRKITERPEGVKLGFSKLVSCKTATIIKEVEGQSSGKLLSIPNPYGDGQASKRIYNILIKKLNNM